MAEREAEAAVADTLRKLAVVFADFEQRLEATPLIRKLTRGRFEIGDHLELRSTLMRHAVTEHRDFRLLEADFVASGGGLEDIQSSPKNVGAEALSAWMFHEASKPDPFGLLGAMFVIEGLGSIKARPWGLKVQERLALPDEAVRFLLYHGDNDAEHMKEFEEMLGMVLPDPFVAERIVVTARVTARLYALQIEEIAA